MEENTNGTEGTMAIAPTAPGEKLLAGALSPLKAPVYDRGFLICAGMKGN